MRKMIIVLTIAAFGCDDPGDTEPTYCDLYPDANACIPAYCPDNPELDGCPEGEAVEMVVISRERYLLQLQNERQYGFQLGVESVESTAPVPVEEGFDDGTCDAKPVTDNECFRYQYINTDDGLRWSKVRYNCPE